MNTKQLLFAEQGAPALSLAHASMALLLQREAEATARAQAAATRDFEPQERHQAEQLLGREMLWHSEFPNGLYLLVCDTPLYRLAALLGHELPRMNGGRELDTHDWCYVADVLREALADSKTVSEELHLSRALGWVLWETNKGRE